MEYDLGRPTLGIGVKKEFHDDAIMELRKITVG